MGVDVRTFESAIVSGAPGVFSLLLFEDAGIETDLVVRPGQRVSVSGDASLPRPPRWGSGGFTVQQRGSLTLRSVTVSSGLSVTNGGNAALTACGGQLTSLTVTTLGGSVSLSNVTLENTALSCSINSDANDEEGCFHWHWYVTCFQPGDGTGGTESTEAYVGEAPSSWACGLLVQATEPRANGATYSDTGCWAEFGMTTRYGNGDYGYQSCQFPEEWVDGGGGH